MNVIELTGPKTLADFLELVHFADNRGLTTYKGFDKTGDGWPVPPQIARDFWKKDSTGTAMYRRCHYEPLYNAKTDVEDLSLDVTEYHGSVIEPDALTLSRNVFFTEYVMDPHLWPSVASHFRHRLFSEIDRLIFHGQREDHVIGILDSLECRSFQWRNKASFGDNLRGIRHDFVGDDIDYYEDTFLQGLWLMSPITYRKTLDLDDDWNGAIRYVLFKEQTFPTLLGYPVKATPMIEDDIMLLADMTMYCLMVGSLKNEKDDPAPAIFVSCNQDICRMKIFICGCPASSTGRSSFIQVKGFPVFDRSVPVAA